MRLSDTLTDITEDVAEAAKREAETEVAYKIAHARALLGLVGREGTVSQKEAQALIQCGDEFAAMKGAEAEYKACAESGRNVRAQLDALRTLASNVRERVFHPSGVGA
jgi:hypothetical protein